jgi:hypothetical protein
MKNERILLAQWSENDLEKNINIPWPLVHKQSSIEEIVWLQKQDSRHVQIILEKSSRKTNTNSLWAEFYDTDIRKEFALYFAK